MFASLYMMMANKDDIKIEIATSVHRDGILRVAEHYVKNEPVRRALNVSWESARSGWAKMIDDCLRVPHSHVAVNGSGQVAGFALCRVVDLTERKPTDSLNDFITFEITRKLEDELMKTWPRVFVNEKGELCKALYQDMGVGVHPDYGNRGIAVRMVQANVKLAKQLGCGYYTVVCSNWMSQRVFEKVGFTTVAVTLFENVKDDEGRPKIKMTDPKQKGSYWQMLKL